MKLKYTASFESRKQITARNFTNKPLPLSFAFRIGLPSTSFYFHHSQFPEFFGNFFVRNPRKKCFPLGCVVGPICDQLKHSNRQLLGASSPPPQKVLSNEN